MHWTHCICCRKPVYVIGSDRCKWKFSAFHKSLCERGVVRPFTGKEDVSANSWFSLYCRLHTPANHFKCNFRYPIVGVIHHLTILQRPLFRFAKLSQNEDGVCKPRVCWRCSSFLYIQTQHTDPLNLFI